MITTKASTRVAGFAAALLVNAALFAAAEKSVQTAGLVLSEDDAVVVQLDRVVVTAQRPARTASSMELSGGASL